MPRSAGVSGHEYLPMNHPRLQRRFHDPHERAAAADVAVESLCDLLACRVRLFLEERHRGDDKAWRAEAAHQGVDVAEGLLHRMQRVARGQALDGADLLALHFDRE